MAMPENYGLVELEKFQIPEHLQIGLVPVKWLVDHFRRVAFQTLNLSSPPHFRVENVLINHPLHPTIQEVILNISSTIPYFCTSRQYLFNDFNNTLERVQASRPPIASKHTPEVTALILNGLKEKRMESKQSSSCFKKFIAQTHREIRFRDTKEGIPPYILTLAYGLHKLDLEKHFKSQG